MPVEFHPTLVIQVRAHLLFVFHLEMSVRRHLEFFFVSIHRR